MYEPRHFANTVNLCLLLFALLFQMSLNRGKSRAASTVNQKFLKENSIRKLPYKSRPKEILRSQSPNILLHEKSKEIKHASEEIVNRALKAENGLMNPVETKSPARTKVAKLISDLEQFSSKANTVVENFSAMTSQIDSLHEELRQLHSSP